LPKENGWDLNLARVNWLTQDILRVSMSGKVAVYVTDFPEEEGAGKVGIITDSSFAASTPESEDQLCHYGYRQLATFLETEISQFIISRLCEMDFLRNVRLRWLIATCRILLVNHHYLGQAKNHIADMINKSKGEVASNLIDLDRCFGKGPGPIRQIDGVFCQSDSQISRRTGSSTNHCRLLFTVPMGIQS